MTLIKKSKGRCCLEFQLGRKVINQILAQRAPFLYFVNWPFLSASNCANVLKKLFFEHVDIWAKLFILGSLLRKIAWFFWHVQILNFRLKVCKQKCLKIIVFSIIFFSSQCCKPYLIIPNSKYVRITFAISEKRTCQSLKSFKFNIYEQNDRLISLFLILSSSNADSWTKQIHLNCKNDPP